MDRADLERAPSGYGPELRVRRRSDYRRIQSRGRRVHTAHFILMLHPSPSSTPRLGVTVTRKVADAVGRNRIKRVVREVFRRNRELFPPGCDVVFVAKPTAPGIGYHELREEVLRARHALANAAERVLRREEPAP